MPTRQEVAANKVFDAIESGGSPSQADLKRGGLCATCWGFGYYEASEEDDTRIDCKACGGTGLRKKHK